MAIAAQIVKACLKSLTVLYNVWLFLVAVGSIKQSGFENIRQLLSCLERGFQIRVLAWLAAVTYLGIGFTITSVCRTGEQQARLWWERQRRGSGLPVAPPGRSKHERGLAIDIIFDSDYELVVDLATLAGITWLGAYDWVHWERKS